MTRTYLTTFRRSRFALAFMASALALGAPPLAAADVPTRGESDEAGVPREPRPVERKYPRPTLLWTATQLVPSPTWFIGGGQVEFALAWQVTPVLYSFGVHKSISPWRFFAADPWARHGGSVELFAAPYLLLNDPRLASKFGSRFYVPMQGHGEALSFATGVSYFVAREGSHVAFDAAFYTASGVLGIEATWVPHLDPYTFALSLRLRSM